MKSPVLVFGCIPRIVVAIARSLHAYGVPVDVANWETGSPIRSRAIREFVRLPNPETARIDFITRLRSLVTDGGYDMLIPADDQALAAVVGRYDDLKDLVHIACPPPNVTRLVLNKASTLEIAEKQGIRVPRTVVASNSAQLEELLGTLPFPWILKPAEKEPHGEEFKSCRLANFDELRKRFPTPCEFRPNILVQEYCEGVGVGIEMLLDKGECRAVFQHRRLKELPHSGGYAVVAVAQQPDPALFQSSLTLLRALQWDGIAMVEFKFNPVDGSAVLMEVNGRYWGTIALPAMAGLDFPLCHWKLVHGELLEVLNRCVADTKWRWTMGYIARLHGLLIAAPRSSAARKVLFNDLVHLSEDFGAAVHDPMLEMSDPAAIATEALLTTKYLLKSDLNALWRRLAFWRQTA